MNNLLAERIRELEQNGELPKFKAALETACCADIDQALNLTRNLDCYDFYPELSSMADYAMQKFLDRYQIPKDAPELKLIRFSRLDFKVMEETNLYTPAYGIIRRNDREMELEYTQPEAGQKMV